MILGPNWIVPYYSSFKMLTIVNEPCRCSYMTLHVCWKGIELDSLVFVVDNWVSEGKPINLVMQLYIRLCAHILIIIFGRPMHAHIFRSCYPQ